MHHTVAAAPAPTLALISLNQNIFFQLDHVVHFILVFQVGVFLMMPLCFTQNGEGPAGPPGPAGVPGINGIDVSALPVRSKGCTVWLPRLALLQSANVFLFQGERGADGEVGLPVTMDCNKEKVICFECGAFSPPHTIVLFHSFAGA